MGSILILFAFTVYHRQVEDEMRELDTQIYREAKRIAALTTYQKQGESWSIDTENVSFRNSDGLESKIIYVRWYDFRQRLLQFTGHSPRQRTPITPGWKILKYDCRSDGATQQKNLRRLTLPLQDGESPVGYLQIAVSLEPLEESLARSRLFLSLGIPVALIFTGIVGWILGSFAMRPARRSYEQLQRFTADASHELRAPISAILSNAQVGLLAPAEDEQQPRQRLSNIVTQSKSISALIANLLFLARHEGQLNPKDVAKTNIEELLSSLGSEYKTLAVEKGLEFHLLVPAKPLEIHSDPDLFKQAIRNLLDNAIKYTSPEGRVDLELVVKPRRILITVKDTGIGIPAADLPHIFERFYRVDKARTRQTGGFGLGLAIAQQIIQAHDGKITVESEFGKGTMFQICLPLRP
ncbi:Alkaline phosphatase synthesis sensor protein PhoR [Acaryochloris thomasi RCC1774]|uniref:histidine kinase n=2 Tax=Acaryochloris TaxID=155977 RepID=A0A2W1JPD8_9CYAN|nr:Alkaline phosphatase synthesis sensor protein PhoR [Acaryochloris thomasi RCC1774]